jgi:hypothetical protein
MLVQDSLARSRSRAELAIEGPGRVGGDPRRAVCQPGRILDEAADDGVQVAGGQRIQVPAQHHRGFGAGFTDSG